MASDPKKLGRRLREITGILQGEARGRYGVRSGVGQSPPSESQVLGELRESCFNELDPDECEALDRMIGKMRRGLPTRAGAINPP